MTAPAEPRYERKHTTVGDLDMAYVDEGDGDPIVFLHGNPTSSYLWRNVMPYLEGHGRLIAPDLIGMGESAKLAESDADSYTFVQHRGYLFSLLEQLGVSDDVTLVVHDWGSALGFDWARRHPDKVKGIAYMEAIVRPTSWAYFPEAAVDMFKGFRSDEGEELILQNNMFVEAVLPFSVIDGPGDDVMEYYRRPYLESGESRRPTLTWPRQIPIDGRPADVHEIVADYAAWLPGSDIPKLLIEAEPGALIQGETLDFCRSFDNQTAVSVDGIHFIQEDSPDEIGQAIAAWLDGLG